MSAIQRKIWCDDDKHEEYEYFSDFNDWLDNEEGQALHLELNIDGLSQPSKALFASDREAYDQAFIQFRNQRRIPLAQNLQELLKRKVDLIPEHELNQHLRDTILAEAVDL